MKVKRKPRPDKSDLSQVFEVDDIFTRKDAISGLKSSPWAGLGKLVNTPLDNSIFLDDITTFNIAFPIPYTLQKTQVLDSKFQSYIVRI